MMKLLGVLLLGSIGVFVGTQPTFGEPPPPSKGTATPETQEVVHLPVGTIRKGTIANAQLIQDTNMGVASVCGMIGFELPKAVGKYVVQDPAGPPGRSCWREKWIITDDHRRYAEIDFRFEEDGEGGAYWTVEHAARVNGKGQFQDAERDAVEGEGKEAAVRANLDRYVEAATSFLKCAQGGDVDGMVGLTSLITIAQAGGGEASKKVYGQGIVRKVSNAVVEWNDTHELMNAADTGNTGVEVGCSVQGEGEKSFPLYIWVMKEDEKYVVTSVSGKRYADIRSEAE